MVPLRHACFLGLNTYGLTHVIPAGSTCFLVSESEREGEVQGESYTADRLPQQVKQHGLSLLYREESSLHTHCIATLSTAAAAAGQPAGKQHRHTYCHSRTCTCARRHLSHEQGHTKRHTHTHRCLQGHTHLTHK